MVIGDGIILLIEIIVVIAVLALGWLFAEFVAHLLRFMIVGSLMDKSDEVIKIKVDKELSHIKGNSTIMSDCLI